MFNAQCINTIITYVYHFSKPVVRFPSRFLSLFGVCRGSVLLLYLVDDNILGHYCILHFQDLRTSGISMFVSNNSIGMSGNFQL